MKIFFEKIGLILLVHIIWEIIVVGAALNTASFNDFFDAISFVMIEPVCLFIIYPIIVYRIIYKIITKEPIYFEDEKKLY